MPRKRDPLITNTDALLTKLVTLAKNQSFSPRASETEDVASATERMTVSEMRMLAETSMKWLTFKASLDTGDDEPAEFEGLLNDLHGRTARRGRRSGGEPASASNGAVHAESVDGSD